MTTIFHEILNMSIVSSWLILAVIFIRFLLKKAPRKMVCLLWALVAVRLVCPFSIESRFSLIPSAQPVEALESQNNHTPLDGVTSDGSSVVKGTIVAGEISDKDVVENGDDTENTLGTEIMNGNGNIPAHFEDHNPQAEGEATPDSQIEDVSFYGVISTVWLLGIAVMFGYGIYSYEVLRRRTGASLIMEKNVYLCDDIDIPFILGVFSPKIYLPSLLAEEEREYVIAHENAHLVRRDHWWKPLGYIILAVHWFNPFVWAAYILLCRDIEIACDEKVISGADSEYKKSYAKTLLECSTGGRLVTACPLAFGEVSVKERIKAVLNYRKPAFWVIVISVIICIGVAICFMTNPTAVSTQTEDESTASVGDDGDENSGQEITTEEDTEENTTEADTQHNSSDADNIKETTDSAVDSGSVRYYDPDSELSCMEQFELAENKISFLNNYIETEGKNSSWKNGFDLYAEEAIEKRPELYEALKKPVTSAAALLNVEYESFETYYTNTFNLIMVSLVSADGEKTIVDMRRRGELWQPDFQVEADSEKYFYVINTNEFINGATAERLKGITREVDHTDMKWMDQKDDFVVLDKADGSDVVLYGLFGGSAMILRDGDEILPIWTSWMSPQMNLPRIYCGDYDNDGTKEYALWTHMNTGTGVSGDELYIIETDWNNGEDGKTEYSIREYSKSEWSEDLETIGYHFDETSKILTVSVGDEETKLDISKMLEKNDGEFDGLSFGNVYSFDESNGQWNFTATSGIFITGSYTPVWECRVIVSGEVIYNEERGFHLENIKISMESEFE